MQTHNSPPNTIQMPRLMSKIWFIYVIQDGIIFNLGLETSAWILRNLSFDLPTWRKYLVNSVWIGNYLILLMLLGCKDSFPKNPNSTDETIIPTKMAITIMENVFSETWWAYRLVILYSITKINGTTTSVMIIWLIPCMGNARFSRSRIWKLIEININVSMMLMMDTFFEKNERSTITIWDNSIG